MASAEKAYALPGHLLPTVISALHAFTKKSGSEGRHCGHTGSICFVANVASGASTLYRRSDGNMRLCRLSQVLRKERSGFRQKAPARKERALTPSRRLKLSAAGPMVLHAPGVWESFGKLRMNSGRFRHK